MRPSSIIAFERVYLLALALDVVNGLMSWGANSAAILSNPSVAAIGPGFVYLSAALRVGIPLLLWYFIARRGSTLAKWLLVALLAIGIAGVAAALSVGAPIGVVAIVGLVLQAAAVAMLFRADARPWFGKAAVA